MASSNGTPQQPNEWYHQGMWRQLDCDDVATAQQVRRGSIDLHWYPQRDTTGIANLNTQVANERAVLHQIVDELDRPDLNAVFRLARLLALVDRDPRLWAYIADKNATFLELFQVKQVVESSFERVAIR